MRATFGLTLLTTLAFFCGCATPAPPPPPPAAVARLAHLELVNLSPCAWRIAFTHTAGRETHIAEVPALSTITLTLAPGDYTLTQTALDGLPPSVSTRRFPATFAAGETYRWPLVTLLTGNAAAP